MNDPHRPEPRRRIVTDDVGNRVLTRAAELDAAQRAAVEISELRAAAAEAGISTSAFDTAVEEMQDGQAVAPLTEHSRPRRWSLVLGAAALVLIGAVTASRLVQSPAPATVEQAFVLRCLAPGEAGQLVRPMLDGTSTVVFSPTTAPRVLTVRTTPDQLREIRATLDRADAAACSGPSPAR